MNTARMVAALLLLLTTAALAIDTDDLAELVGFTIVAASNVTGDFEGADFDKKVALDNGMIFEFSTYSYMYSYRPTAVVLAKTFNAEQLAKLGVKNPSGRSVTLYKLVVDDEIYDVRRIR